MTLVDRRAGLLVHPTALPGPHGQGDLGRPAHAFLAQAEAAGASVWQVLPLLPPDGYGSPYQPRSAFALDPGLASPEDLVDAGWLAPDEAGLLPARGRVDRDGARALRERALRTAWERARGEVGAELDAFRERAPWCRDWALFCALERDSGGPWWRWDEPLATRDPDALAAAADRLADEVALHTFVQWRLERLLYELRGAAGARGLKLLGDLPMFVGRHSDLAWRDPAACGLDGGRAAALAGVPAAAGEPAQHWGLPVWDWEVAARDGFALHRERFDRALASCDLLRLDHFAGYARTWVVTPDDPAGAHRDGPRDALFDAVEADRGPLPAVVEDVGDVDESVFELRDRRGYASTRVLLNGLGPGGGDPAHRPAGCPENAVLYTSTHDTDTWLGGWRRLDRAAREGARAELGHGRTAARDLGLVAAWHAPARLAVAALQDLCGLGTRARTNRPGTTGGNWRWRLAPDRLLPERLAWLRDLTRDSDRLPS